MWESLGQRPLWEEQSGDQFEGVEPSLSVAG